MCCNTFILIICAIIFPPFPVLLVKGLCSSDFLLNVLLTLLGYIPGLVHSIIVIAKRQEGRELDRWYYQQGWIARDRLSESQQQQQQQNNQQNQQPGCSHSNSSSNQYNTQPEPVSNSQNSENTNLLPKGSPPPYTV